MGLVEILDTLFNKNLVLPDNFGFKKEVTLSLNIYFFIKICILKKVKIDHKKVDGDEISILIFILEKRKIKTLVRSNFQNILKYE